MYWGSSVSDTELELASVLGFNFVPFSAGISFPMAFGNSFLRFSYTTRKTRPNSIKSLHLFTGFISQQLLPKNSKHSRALMTIQVSALDTHAAKSLNQFIWNGFFIAMLLIEMRITNVVFWAWIWHKKKDI